MSDLETELAEYIEKCRAMHRNQVGKTPRFAHAVAALAEQLDHARAELAEAKREIEVLRQYGNKDCTAMADAALKDTP